MAHQPNPPKLRVADWFWLPLMFVWAVAVGLYRTAQVTLFVVASGFILLGAGYFIYAIFTQ